MGDASSYRSGGHAGKQDLIVSEVAWQQMTAVDCFLGLSLAFAAEIETAAVVGGPGMTIARFDLFVDFVDGRRSENDVENLFVFPGPQP